MSGAYVTYYMYNRIYVFIEHLSEYFRVENDITNESAKNNWSKPIECLQRN